MVQREVDIEVFKYRLPTVFTPAAPVTQREMFAGRSHEITQVLGAVSQIGQHAVIYGERGVGKTSLASVITDIWGAVSKNDENLITARVNCDTTDIFPTIWRKVAEEIEIYYDRHPKEQRPVGDVFSVARSDMLHDDATPNSVRRYLQIHDKEFIIIIDEFDRIEDRDATQLFADTIKSLSDHIISSTLIIVGVADTVEQLIEGHNSVNRALVQIVMPRMTNDEVKELVTTRLQTIGGSITTQALYRIASLSQGLPHYAHLLGLNSGAAASERNSLEIDIIDVDTGLNRSIDGAQESTRNAYHEATMSPRTENLYKQVLLACAMAKVDELGYFAPADVRGPMTKIMGKPYEIPAFSRHLNALCQDERGRILQKIGSERKWRYRFVDPLIKPYILVRGVTEELVKATDIANGKDSTES